MYPIITIVFGHFPRAPGRMSFILKCASAKPRGFLFFFLIYIYIYIFQQSQACMGSIPESQLKSKISHSLIHIGFIGLVMWSGVRGLWKKRSKRLKECLRVILSKNLESLACILFISTFELSFTPFVLYINPYCTFWAFLVKSGDPLSLFFFFTRLWQILFSFSFHCCPTLCMYSLHCSSRRFSGGSLLGFLFCFCYFFFLFLENKYALAQRG